jgi:hypothetical protein
LRRSAGSALAVVALLAGCGGSRANGDAEKPAAQVFADAQRAALSASSVHVHGSVLDGAKRLHVDLRLVKGSGGKGTMAEGGVSFDLVRVGRDAYLRGSDAFLRGFAGKGGQQLLHGKWLKGPAASADLKGLLPLTDLAKLFNAAFGSHGKLRNAGETSYDGRDAIAVVDVTKGGTLYVASTGTPYPIAIVDAKEKTAVHFDDWNKPATVTAPKGAIDIGR